jgi:hypothetical protein
LEKVVAKYNLGEEPEDWKFWLTKTPAERLAALQALRERYIKFFLNGVRPGFQRVYTVTERK